MMGRLFTLRTKLHLKILYYFIINVLKKINRTLYILEWYKKNKAMCVFSKPAEAVPLVTAWTL